MNDESEVLTGLSVPELEALADGVLAPAAQSRLRDLLERSVNGQLTSGEQRELDRLVGIIDQLNILKTRARFTLNRDQMEAARK